MKEILPFFTLLFVLHLNLPIEPFFYPINTQNKLEENTMEATPQLPETVGNWTRPDSPQFIDSKNIFDYMDGAGELYLAYRFDHLDSYEYRSETQKEILVELYFMESSDDAFGLLSLDWGGEPVNLHVQTSGITESDRHPWPRALYGEGLLRIWSDSIYARVMATQETPESKQAVLDLGRTIVKGRKDPPPPGLMQTLPAVLQQNWKLRKDRAGYLRSHLVLNSLYYLGHENMLNLDHTTEVATAPYERPNASENRSRIQLLTAKYVTSEQAIKALAHFQQAYLPDYAHETGLKISDSLKNTFLIEDGWLGYTLKNNTLSLIFECPDRETAIAMTDQID